MTLTVNLHDVERVEFQEYKNGFQEFTWLRITSKADQSTCLFMPREQAKAMADAFNAVKPATREITEQARNDNAMMDAAFADDASDYDDGNITA
jgi:hypothetical protein